VGNLAPPAVARLGLAMARVLRARAAPGHTPRVLMGRDTRLSGPSVAAALSSGLLAGGVEVHDGGVLPTPGVALLVRRRKYDLGCMVSASHNPWPDNGIKLLASHGSKLDDEEEAAIERAYRDRALASRGDPTLVGALEERRKAPQEYARAIESEFRGLRLRGLHVVVDAGNGAQSGLASRVLRRLGARVTALMEAPDGRNINEGCGAMHTGPLRRRVRLEGADLGIAFDGDADRVQLCDERGRLLDGDVILAALGPRLLRARKLRHRTVVGTLMTNGALEVALAKDGIRLLRTPVGDRHIVAAMREHGYGLGGEPSGHMILPRRGLLTGDGLVAALACLRILAEERLSASELAGSYKAWPLEIVSFRVRERPAIETLPRTSVAIEEALGVLDGSGRVVVRYSGTEPKVRVMIESRRRKLLASTMESIVGALREEVGES
jgi:phosphoglucosamine mutase